MFNSAITTALLLYPLGRRALPTVFPSTADVLFSLSCYFCFFRQIWGDLWRPRGLRLSPRARARSSRRRRSTASQDLRSLGSEMGGKFPPAAACECSLTSVRSVWGGGGVVQCRQASVGPWEFNTVGRFPSICLHTPCQSQTEVYEQILVQSPSSSAKLDPVIKQVIIAPLLTLQAVIEG